LQACDFFLQRRFSVKPAAALHIALDRYSGRGMLFSFLDKLPVTAFHAMNVNYS